MKIDITMSAVIRPLILDTTLQSFCENLFNQNKHEYRLIMNVDPIGDDIRRKSMIKTARKYFENIILNEPENPGFTKAVIWCWSKVTADYVFHLEDDWILLNKIDMDSMIKILDKNSSLVSLRLSKSKNIPNKQGRKLGYQTYPKISLNPTLFKGGFIKTIVPLMDENLNPEKQLRIDTTRRGHYLSLWDHGIYVKESYDRIVKDIGRNWMDNSKYTKKIGFMNWEIKE